MRIYGGIATSSFFFCKSCKKPSLPLIGLFTATLASTYLYVDSIGCQRIYKRLHRYYVLHLKKHENLEALTDVEARQILQKEIASTPFPQHLLESHKGKSPEDEQDFETLMKNTQQSLSQMEKKPHFFSLKAFGQFFHIPFILSLWELFEEPPIFFKLWNLEFRQKLSGFLKMPFATPLTLYTSKRLLKLLLSLSHRYGIIDKKKVPFKSLFNAWDRLLQYPLQSLSDKDKKSVIELVEVLLITLVVYYFHLKEQEPYMKGSLQLSSLDRRCFSLPQYKEALPAFSLKNRELLTAFCEGKEQVCFLSATPSIEDWELQSLSDQAVGATLKNFELLTKAQRATGGKKLPNLFYFDPSPFSQSSKETEDKKMSRYHTHRSSLLYLEKKMRRASYCEGVPVLIIEGNKLMSFLESDNKAFTLYQDFFHRVRKIPSLKIIIKNPPLENCKDITALLPHAPMLSLEISPAHLLCQGLKKYPFVFYSSEINEFESEKIKHLNEFCKQQVALMSCSEQKISNLQAAVQKEFLSLLENYQKKLVEKIHKLDTVQPSVGKKYQTLMKLNQKIAELKLEGKKLSISLVGTLEGRDVQDKKERVNLLEDPAFAKISSKQCLLYEYLLPLLKEKQQCLKKEIIQTLKKEDAGKEEKEELDFFSYLAKVNKEKQKQINASLSAPSRH